MTEQEQIEQLPETEVQKPRMEICRSCEHLNTLKFCNKCGCFMPFKTRLETAGCPLLKW